MLTLITLFLGLIPLTTDLDSSSRVDHDFHMSRCQIVYDQKTAGLQIILHVFLDDLERAIRPESYDSLYFYSDKEVESADELLLDYLEKHLQFEVNGDSAKYNYIGREISDDLAATWCYLEVPDIQVLRTLSVKNDMLMELFDDQKNIIDITGPHNQRGYFLFHQGKFLDKVDFE